MSTSPASTSGPASPPPDTWLAQVGRLAISARREVAAIVEQDPAFAFREAARLLRDRVVTDLPDAVADKALEVYAPAVRLGTFVLDMGKARRTLEDPSSNATDRVVDVSHVITDAVGVAGFVVLAVPAGATGVGTTLAAVAVAGDLVAYGYHLLRYIQRRGEGGDDSTLALAVSGSPPDEVLDDSASALLVPCALLWDGRLVPADSVLGGYHGTSRIAPEEAFRRGLVAGEALSDTAAGLRAQEGGALRLVSELVADPVAGAGAAEEAGEGGWVYEIRDVPTWPIAATQDVQESFGRGRDAADTPAVLALIPNDVPASSIVRAGRVERLPSGRLAVRSWVDNPSHGVVG